MLKFTIRRLLTALPVLFIVVTLVFFMARILPGDPAVQILGPDADPADIEALREQLGLNDPLGVQYMDFLKGLAKGDWGDSLYNGKPVLENIFSRLEPTLMLAAYSSVIAVAVGIPFGIIAAKKRNTLVDYCLTTLSATGLSAPGFWLGMMMVFYLGVELKWFPVQGYTFIAEGGIGGALYSLTLPAVSAAVGTICSYTRYTRSMMLEVMGDDYVRTARAKGLRESIVYYKHALKNALAPVVTNIGFNIAGCIGGATVTETVFNIPGMGKLAYDSLMRRDYNQQTASIIFMGIILIFTNILMDIVYKWLDPRIEFD